MLAARQHPDCVIRVLNQSILSLLYHTRINDIKPGSLLDLDFYRANCEVVVNTGSHEEIIIESDSGVCEPVRDQDTIKVSPVGNAFEANKLVVSIPGRFTSLRAASNCKAVSVEAIHEAGSCRVETNGGDAFVGRCKAMDVHLNSSGGAVRCHQITGANVIIQADPGPLRIDSLHGEDASVKGTPLHLGSVYVKRLQAEACNRTLSIQSLDSCCAQISSHGGDVRIGGHDGGDVHVKSLGGNVSIQVNNKAGDITIDSAGGDVDLFLSPGLAGGSLHIISARLVTGSTWVTGATMEAVEIPPSTTKGERSMVGVPHSRLEALKDVTSQKKARIVVSAVSGQVTITERNWLEAALSKAKSNEM